MTFIDTYPVPDADTATARDVAGWHAAHALYLLGRAARREELHGTRDTDARNLAALADAKAGTAYALHATDSDACADHIAHMLLTGRAAVGATEHRTTAIAKRGGYDPHKTRRAGYES